MKAVSFNVLADAYINYGDYSHVQDELLRPGARHDRIVDLIKGLDASILGLQEADEVLASKLSDSEYQPFWTPKAGGKFDGCLTLVRRDIKVDSFESYEYSDGSGHVAQFIKIGKAVLANTHIKWAPADSADHIGVGQAQELIDNLRSSHAVIFADCNDQPGGPVRRVIEEAGFINLIGDRPTALVNQMPLALDLLAVRGVIGRDQTPFYDLHEIPNVIYPSDHIPLEVDLDLPLNLRRY